MKLSMEIDKVAERLGDIRAVELIKEAGFDAIDYSYYYTKECEAVLGEGYKGDLTFEIVKQIELYPDELLPDALKFANAVGRHLISLCESA